MTAHHVIGTGITVDITPKPLAVVPASELHALQRVAEELAALLGAATPGPGAGPSVRACQTLARRLVRRLEDIQC